MTGTELRKPRGVSRIFFQEIREGDRRKLEARSNDAASGGGARDLRVPHAKFGPIFRRLFPNDKVVQRRRGGIPKNTTLYSGKLYWVEEGATKEVAVEYEPPTDARPSEGRIGRIHDIPVLADGVPPEGAGRVFLLLVQEDNGKVFPHYVTAAQLADPRWNRDISKAIQSCMLHTAEGATVRGFVDYSTGERYCHGG